MPVGYFRRAGQYRVIFDGQSLNNIPWQADDVYNSGNVTSKRTNEQNYPSRCMSGLGVAWSNVSVSGFGWVFLKPTEASRLHSLFTTSGETDYRLVLCGGQGDITGYAPLIPEGTPFQVYDRMGTYAARAKAAATIAGKNLVVIGTTIPPAPSLYTIGQETVRQSANSAILANIDGYFDDTVDLGTVSLIDNVHPNAQGAKDMAADVLAVLTPYL